MSKLIKYEFRKHSKLIAALIFVIITIQLYDILILSNNNSSFSSGNVLEEINELFFSIVFAFSRLFLFGLFIYFINDFINNLMTDEKNFIFSIPLKSSEFILSKIISVSIFTAIIVAVFTIVPYINMKIQGYPFSKEINIMQTAKVLSSLFAISLVALQLGYLTVLSTKKILEKTEFQFIWLIPFSLVFSIYFIIMNMIVGPTTELTILPISESWTVTGLGILLGIIIFLINSYLLENKVDI